jgi:SPP1 family phage portal protein
MNKAKLNEQGELALAEITDFISNNTSARSKYLDNVLYFKGLHSAIAGLPTKDLFVPDNRIPIPYARKISLTTKSYLFAKEPMYTADDKGYMERLQQVFYINRNQKKVADIGLDLIVHGRAYKLHYYDVIAGEKMPLYSVIPPDEIITVYDYSVEPKLIAAIRYYDQTDVSTKKTETLVEVYYPTKSMRYKLENSTLIPDSRNPIKNPFPMVQVVSYGDDYEIGVFEPIKKIIDAIDILVSSDLNEVQRFELLYMVLVGDTMPEDPEELKRILQRRIFELSNKDAKLSYLQKDINADFNMRLFDNLKQLIHELSFVPDFESKDFAALSGIALLYKMMSFEQLAADIESEFIDGELRSIDCINSLLYPGFVDRYTFQKASPGTKTDIKLFRNLPEDTKAKLEEAGLMKTLGVSMETILDYIPTVKDTAVELERIAGERKKNFEEFQKMQIPQTEEKPDETVVQ